MFMLCEGRVRVFFPSNLHAHPQLYKVSDVRPPVLIFFFFLSKQDAYRRKVTYVPSRFQNPLSRTSHFSTISSSRDKYESFVEDQTFLQYRYYNFHTPHKVDGEGFFSRISTLKTVPSDKTSTAAHAQKGVKCP